jgi:predicted nucleic acid-binding protein
LRGERLVAPHVVDLEVASVWRRQVAAGRMENRRALLALADLLDLPMQRAPHDAVLPRCWELRDNVTVYDAVYVALAEAIGVSLVTGDQRLHRATGVRCTIEIIR